MNRRWRAFASAMLIVCGAQALAQSDSTATTHQLDATVIVAHRIPTDLRASTAAVSVITRADLERTQARTLPEALRYVPGLVFSSRDGGGALPLVAARGFFGGGENEYVLLMVDGIPVNSPRTSLVEWMSIPVAAIERIELFRGSGSVLYGDAAMGGVINVITRAPTTDAVRAILGVAENGTWEAAFGLARKLPGRGVRPAPLRTPREGAAAGTRSRVASPRRHRSRHHSLRGAPGSGLSTLAWRTRIVFTSSKPAASKAFFSSGIFAFIGLTALRNAA